MTLTAAILGQLSDHDDCSIEEVAAGSARSAVWREMTVPSYSRCELRHWVDSGRWLGAAPKVFLASCAALTDVAVLNTAVNEASRLRG
jgi:hypothetical protein